MRTLLLTRRRLLRAGLVLLLLALLCGLVFLLMAGEALLLRRYAPELLEDPDFWRNWQLMTALSDGAGGILPVEGAADPAVAALAEGPGSVQEVLAPGG